MTVPLLHRAISSLETEGRTLTGMAMPWDKPALVSDDGGRTRYREAFAPSSHDRSLSDIHGGPTRPLFISHNYRRDPIGTSTFRPSVAEGGNMFEGHVSKTRAGDEALELVKDGAMGSVSEGFKPIKALKRADRDGPLTYRTEVAVRELSLAPTGFGQHPDARVLSVRQQAETVLRDVVNSEDPDQDPAVISQAIDATNDALAVALAAGDFASAAALSAAIDLAVDHLLELFKAPDPDEGSDALSPEGAALAAAPNRAQLRAWLDSNPVDVIAAKPDAPDVLTP